MGLPQVFAFVFWCLRILNCCALACKLDGFCDQSSLHRPKMDTSRIAGTAFNVELKDSVNNFIPEPQLKLA